MYARYILLILQPLCLAARTTTRPATTKPARLDQAKSSKVFGLTKTWTIHIHVSAAAWKKMQPTRASRMFAAMAQNATTRPAPSPAAPAPAATTRPRYSEGERLDPNPFGLEYAYVRATIDFDGQRMQDVGLRFKGNSSYTSAYGTPRLPFKMDFNRFVPGQKFCNLTTLNLHNNAFDPSHMREAISYQVYRKLGVPSPRTAFALVYLTVDGLYDREYLGLYTVVEQIDRHFLAHRFGSDKGLLLKPEGIRGGLPYAGEDWSDYDDRMRPKTYPTTRSSHRVIDLCRLITNADDATFRAQIDSLMNVDEFLRFLAATTLVANLDSLLVTDHNFYLYLNPADQKICWMPWDLNLAFGSFSPVARPPDQARLSVDHPDIANRLIDRILGIDEFKAAYHGHLKKAIGKPFSPQRIQKDVNSIRRKVLARADAAAIAAGRVNSPTTRPSGSPWLVAPPDISEFVRARVASVRSQLQGNDGGFVLPQRKGPGRAPGRRVAAPVTRPSGPARQQ